MGKWAVMLTVFKDHIASPCSFRTCPLRSSITSLAHPHVFFYPIISLFNMSTFTSLVLHWVSSKPKIPPMVSPSLQVSSLTLSRLNNGPFLVSTSKNTQSWPPSQNHSQLIARESSFPKSSSTTACHSPWKVYLDIVLLHMHENMFYLFTCLFSAWLWAPKDWEQVFSLYWSHPTESHCWMLVPPFSKEALSNYNVLTGYF